MTKTILLILSVICFAIGAFTKLAPGDINWTNAGLAFATASFVAP